MTARRVTSVSLSVVALLDTSLASGTKMKGGYPDDETRKALNAPADATSIIHAPDGQHNPNWNLDRPVFAPYPRLACLRGIARPKQRPGHGLAG